jgi:hypothetical protein
MNKQITKAFIRKQIEIEFNDPLGNNNPLEQEAKLNKWKDQLEKGYQEFLDQIKKNKLQEKIKLDIENFAKEIFNIHHHNYELKRDSTWRKSYYKDNTYFKGQIQKLIDQTIQRNQENHIFDPTNTNPILRSLQNLIHLYQTQFHLIENLNVSKKDRLVLQLSQRSLEQIKTGIILISYNLFNDSFIVWRSFFEVVVYLKNIQNSDETSANKFYERKESAKEFNQLKNTTKVGLESRMEELNNRVKNDKIEYWEKERYSWILGNGETTFNLRTLARKVDLAKKYPYYSIASLFTHEYLLNESDFEVIHLENLILSLYWHLFEELRKILNEKYKTTFNVSEIQTLEVEIRKIIKGDKGQFDDFTTKISKFKQNF